MKIKFSPLLIATFLFTASCSKEQVQYSCQCCGGYINGCGSPTLLSADNRENARANCASGSDIDAGVICDLN